MHRPISPPPRAPRRAPARTAALTLALLATLALCPAARADALADLKAALQKLPATAPIKGSVSVKVRKQAGEGQEAEDQQGQTSLGFEDGPPGLHLQYTGEQLARVRVEDQAREADPAARTPVLTGLGALGLRDVRELTGAADSLLRQIQRSTFRSEKAEAWNGKPARVLSFDLGLPKMAARQQKYVKHHEGTLTVWVGADGLPLAAHSTQTVSGRAMVVISFEMKQDEDLTYALVGERLVATRRITHNSGSGAGEHSDERSEWQLQATPG